ncbi:MAG TPA: peptide-methionine (S)-S-oxide reductase MsrA [Acholeplasmataceae bacterium]|nr:peptide-methionine (S)-S-oxide reductase MsrA [Acholeplasmataceae bacterium]
MKTIYLAGGCFWGVEGYFKRLNGVLETSVGYINGNDIKPTYELVCSGIATHAEAVKVIYDENLISLDKILAYFFRVVDPYAVNKQGNDVGIQYRSGIYYDDISIRNSIITYIKNKFGDKYINVKTEVEINKGFFTAEDYHQDYLEKNINGYCHINLLDIDKGDLK